MTSARLTPARGSRYKLNLTENNALRYTTALARSLALVKDKLPDGLHDGAGALIARRVLRRPHLAVSSGVPVFQLRYATSQDSNPGVHTQGTAHTAPIMAAMKLRIAATSASISVFFLPT